MAEKIIVLGLGNVLHSDDGVGPRAVERLRGDPRIPNDVAIIEGGTLGLELLPYLWDVSRMLVIDAVDVGEAPGTIVRVAGEEVGAVPGRGSIHQLGVSDLLVALRVLAGRTPEIMLIGVQPASTEWGTTLSAPVEANFDLLLDAAVAELHAWNVESAAQEDVSGTRRHSFTPAR